jgi:RecA/RadA recombinase
MPCVLITVLFFYIENNKQLSKNNLLNRMFLSELLEEPLQGITLVYGPAASGKSTVCFSALTARSVYMTSASNLSTERIHSLRTDASVILEKLVVFTPADIIEWERAVEQAVKLSTLSQLIVLDTPATALRAAPRTMANLSLHRMLKLLATAQCPILITSEVYDRAENSGADVQFVGGDMLRLAARTIVELKDGVATVKKHPLHAGREWEYSMQAQGLVRT